MNPIGVINTPYKKLEQMPIQPKGADKTISEIIIKKNMKLGWLIWMVFHIFI